MVDREKRVYDMVVHYKTMCKDYPYYYKVQELDQSFLFSFEFLEITVP